MSRYLTKSSCPRCGASKCHQRFQPRTIDLSKREYADEFNPVDAVLCPRCETAFRVSRLESDGLYIYDWMTEYECTPNFCPLCGFDLQGAQSKEMSERDAEIITKRARGMTLQAIGDEYGLTRQRISQICKEGR